MLWGEGGTGKGVLYNDILTPLLNNQVAQCNTAEEFLGSHANALAETMLVMLDDVKFNSDAAATKLKSRQSEPTVRMNPKGEQPYTQNVYSRIIYASNESRPLKLSKTDTRRWFVPDWIGYKVSAEETAAFFVKFRDWLHNDPTALDGIYHYLSNYSLEGFEVGYVAITPALAQFVSMGESTLEIQVKEWVEKNRIFKFDELVSTFDRQPDLAKLYAFNTHENKRVIDPDGKGRSKWFVPKGWGAREIRAYWDENGKELPSYL
jgi:hypothetical protein